MKKGTIVWWYACLVVFVFVTGVFAEDLIWEDIGRGYRDFKTIFIDPDDSNIIYAGTTGYIIKSEDAGAGWRVILNTNSQSKSVNLLFSAEHDKNSIYAATANGLYYSSNKGRDWKRIFRGKNNFESECLSLVAFSETIYLGTRGGLFVSKDKGRSWHKEISKIGDNPVFVITYTMNEPNCIYVVSVNGLYKTGDSGNSWEKIFVASAIADESDSGEDSEDKDEEMRTSDIKYLAIDQGDTNKLYLATSKGVLKSSDKGKSWEYVSSFGLLSREVNFILVSRTSRIYAITKSGIFEYTGERWHELSLKLAAKKINFLSWDKQYNIYAACDSGLFKSSLNYSGKESSNNIMEIYYKNEPKIDEIQMVAIQYAEVQPEKIKEWREKAAKKALLPQVNVGLDRNATDLWHWESGSTTKSDDDVLRRGRDCVEWDINLSWDLGDIIWNNDQVSIDTRSRLMVQLREDILDQVTKIYFERIRVKAELNDISIEDRKKRFEKELRLRELTATLDALTGGYFSKKKPNSNVGI